MIGRFYPTSDHRTEVVDLFTPASTPTAIDALKSDPSELTARGQPLPPNLAAQVPHHAHPAAWAGRSRRRNHGASNGNYTTLLISEPYLTHHNKNPHKTNHTNPQQPNPPPGFK
ncbi:hypothetical protein GCM10018966_026190 [Streptomyces yanii]